MRGKIALSVCTAIAACDFSAVDLVGRPCPCVPPQFVCNEATNRCESTSMSQPAADGGAAGFSFVPIVSATILPGKTGILHVQIAREPWFHDSLSIAPLGTPPFLTLSTGVIPQDGSGVDIRVSVSSGASAGTIAAVRLSASGGDQTAETTASVLVAGIPGTLDATFGDRGAVKFDTAVFDLFERPDGRILCGSVGTPKGSNAATTPTVYRLNADGSKDTTFGIDGKATASTTDRATDLVVQRDGKIVLFGDWYEDVSSTFPIAVRLQENGTIDSTFGENGRWVHPTYKGRPGGAALADDDSLLGAAGPGAFVFKLTPSGALDASFGTSGTVKALPGTNAQPLSLVLPSGNKILTAGGTYSGSGAYMIRYLSNGALDTTFASGGVLLDATLVNFEALGLQSSGQILAGGRVAPSGVALRVQRNDAVGKVDGTFSSVTFAGNTTYSSSCRLAMAVLPDDSFVAGGDACDAHLTRFSSNGVPDAQFGAQGVVTLPAVFNVSSFDALLVTRDGRMIVSVSPVNSISGSTLYRIWL